MKEREFHLLKLYVHKEGWRLAFIEIINFDTGNDWVLLALHWQRGQWWINLSFAE